MADGRPLLLHLPISHYSEKVRWALDWKRMPHRRRVVPPGAHPVVASAVMRAPQPTLPVMRFDGEWVAGSSAIIARLEERAPSPPLYPLSGADRARALELEEWFDTRLGPAVRRWLFSELLGWAPSRREVALKQVEWAAVALPAPAVAGFVDAFAGSVYGAGGRRDASEAWPAVLEALDFLEESLSGSGEFLVGDAFTVADLTAAALFYPLVLPSGAPWVPSQLPPPVEEARASVAARPGFRWVGSVWERCRRPGPGGLVASV